MSSLAREPVFDWLAPGVFVDPHPMFHRMRVDAPVHFDTRLGAWVLTSYHDVHAAMRDPRFGPAEQLKRIDALPRVEREALAALRRIFSAWAGQLDADHHARFQRLLRPVFTPARVEELRPQLQATLDELVGRALDGDEFDAANDLARPFAMHAMAEWLGLHTDDVGALMSCANRASRLLEMGEPEQLHSCQDAVLELYRQVQPAVAHRRSEPSADLISTLVSGDHFDDEFVIAQCIMFLIVGYYPTGNVLANGLQLLLEHPEQKARLAGDPELVTSALEEMVRHAGPPSSTRKLATTDVTIRDTTIRKGDSVVLAISAANRDPEVFDDPDRFDIARTGLNRHLGFAIAPYACLGRALVRLEGELFFGTLLDRAPKLQACDAAPEWVPFRPFGRELKTLPARPCPR